MNEKAFLDELIQYSLENLKRLDCAPNVDYIEPSRSLDERDEVMSSLVRKKDHINEYYDDDDQK
jgi:hypothetical protein